MCSSIRDAKSSYFCRMVTLCNVYNPNIKFEVKLQIFYRTFLKLTIFLNFSLPTRRQSVKSGKYQIYYFLSSIKPIISCPCIIIIINNLSKIRLSRVVYHIAFGIIDDPD